MTTKNQELYYIKGDISAAIQHMIKVKTMDIKSRKIAKASRKAKWSKSIKKANIALDALRLANSAIKQIPKRV